MGPPHMLWLRYSILLPRVSQLNLSSLQKIPVAMLSVYMCCNKSTLPSVHHKSSQQDTKYEDMKGCENEGTHGGLAKPFMGSPFEYMLHSIHQLRLMHIRLDDYTAPSN